MTLDEAIKCAEDPQVRLIVLSTMQLAITAPMAGPLVNCSMADIFLRSQFVGEGENVWRVGAGCTVMVCQVPPNLNYFNDG